MLLDDAESKIEVMRALEAGDEELREDIKEKLEEASDRWNSHRSKFVTPTIDPDFSYHLPSSAFVDAVIDKSPSRYDLSEVPRDIVVAQLEHDQDHARVVRGQRRWGPFHVSEYREDFTFVTYEEMQAFFPDADLPFNSDVIPTDMAREFWERLDGGVTWDQVDRVEENFGRAYDGDRVYIVADGEEFAEWCRDLVAEHANELAKTDPVAAREAFYASVSSEESALGAKLRAANLPEEELLDLATKWFGDEEDREEALASIREYFASIEEGADIEREVIGEWTQADLREMGITKGPLYEEAPWKLIKLRPSDLRLEGALMRHCVGDRGMGYISAVKEGEVEIWSLRSRSNKPRFTLEVDGSFYTAEEDSAPRTSADVLRAQAIKQVKGKANRTPGFAGARDTLVKFRDEVLFWKSAFRQLGIYPESVEDFHAMSHLIVHENPTSLCTGFDLPYRPLRSSRQALRRRTSR